MKKNTAQCLMIITVETQMQPFLSVRNFICKKLATIRALRGEVIGHAGDGTKTLRGTWHKQTAVIVLAFDNMDGAMMLYNSLHLYTEFMQHVEVFIPALCNPVLYAEDYQYLELTFYEVKYPKRFQWYVNQLPQWCSDNGGTFLGGTSRVNQMMGMTRPNYITVTQWKTEEDYAKYHRNGNTNVFPTLFNTG
ncbi:hypothetical protein AAHC03_0243 [Spirometra sp. Aus1]